MSKREQRTGADSAQPASSTRRKSLKMVTPERVQATTASDLLANHWQTAVQGAPSMEEAGSWTRPELLVWVWSPPAGIEPATPSLPWNHKEPLCGPPFPQVGLDRRSRSYRFSSCEGMRSQ